MNLAGISPGESYKALLTLPTANPVTGTLYRVEWGDGTATPLFLGNGIVGVGSSDAAMSQITSEATGLRSVVLPDEAGRAQLAPLTGTRSVVLGSNQVTSATTPASITGLALTLPVGTWLVHFAGQYRSSNTDNGARFSLLGTGATVQGGGCSADIEGVPTANADIGVTGAYLVTVSSGSGTVTMQHANDEAARTLTTMAGTFLAAVRIF